MMSRPTHATGFLDLPLCRLHIARAGHGPPLVMLPATISLLENWYELIDFAAQWYEVIFFELPGHGQSSCFCQPFAVSLLGPLVEQTVEQLGYQKFSLMGFSFGGVLTMEVLKYLHPRVEQVILLSPCLNGRAIQLHGMRRALVLRLAEVLQRKASRDTLHHLLHDPPFRAYSAAVLRSVGRVEASIPMEQVLGKITPTTLEILGTQISTALRYDWRPELKFAMPCFFAMSVHDPLIDYRQTRKTLEYCFSRFSTTELDYPFHQPPRPFTFEELNRDFREQVDSFLGR